VSTLYLELHNVHKRFGLRPVLRDVSLALSAGERLALLGANGTGKTTLLRILAGLTRPGGGSVTIGGLNLCEQMREVQRVVGFVAHQPYLYAELSALENLLFFARMYGLKRPAERAETLLQRVGLGKRSRERVAAFSRGQLQRLALARALLHTPDLLLLDEPETGLDQEGLALLADLLHEHRARGGTLLFTTHDLESAPGRSDRVALLSRGRVVYQRESAGLDQGGIRRVYQEVTL
jgi:heme ABC exporter ATP-binding subunit CcmA